MTIFRLACLIVLLLSPHRKVPVIRACQEDINLQASASYLATTRPPKATNGEHCVERGALARVRELMQFEAARGRPTHAKRQRTSTHMHDQYPTELTMSRRPWSETTHVTISVGRPTSEQLWQNINQIARSRLPRATRLIGQLSPLTPGLTLMCVQPSGRNLTHADLPK